MAMYYCNDCGEYIDDDWNPGIEHGDCELICESCAQAYECQWCGEYDESLTQFSMHKHCHAEALAEHQADLRKDKELHHEC